MLEQNTATDHSPGRDSLDNETFSDRARWLAELPTAQQLGTQDLDCPSPAAPEGPAEMPPSLNSAPQPQGPQTVGAGTHARAVSHPAAKRKKDDFELNPGQHWHRGINYASRSEAACGDLMERYIPGFQVIEHKSFQVPIYDYNKGTTKTVDFLVNGVYVEFHPPRFWREGKRYGDFKSASEYFSYRHKLKSLDTPEEKRAFREETQKLLTERYAGERQAIIARFKGDPNIELIVATSAESVYENVIRRFGQGYPPKAEFLKQFWAVVDEVKANNSDIVKAKAQRDFQRNHRP